MPNVHAPAGAFCPLASVKSPVSPVTVGAISPPCASRGAADRASAATQAPNLLFIMCTLPPTVSGFRGVSEACLFYNGPATAGRSTRGNPAHWMLGSPLHAHAADDSTVR